jgi:hypothetical protein
MTYFHIGDLMYHEGGIMSRKKYEKYFKEAGTLKNRLLRYVKTNLGTKGAFDKMCTLIGENKFISSHLSKISFLYSSKSHVGIINGPKHL